MEVATALRVLRRRSGSSLRQLGRAAGTSHATLAAYEAGRVSPTAHTLERIVRAAGFELEPAVVRRVPDADRRGYELEQVLDLAEQFPSRHSAVLRAPVFGR